MSTDIAIRKREIALQGKQSTLETVDHVAKYAIDGGVEVTKALINNPVVNLLVGTFALNYMVNQWVTLQKPQYNAQGVKIAEGRYMHPISTSQGYLIEGILFTKELLNAVGGTSTLSSLLALLAK